jgi:hypothetical protein
LNGRDSGPPLQTMPNRIDSLKWILVGGFAMLFALGLAFLWRRPVAMVAMGPEDAALPVSLPQGPRKKAARAPAAPRVAEPVAAASSPSQNVAAVEVEVEHSLDTLKDKLFRLELRHQAGTISEEEYARERGRTEQILRELLRG